MLTIYGYEGTRSLRAVWAAEEAGVDYQYVRIDLHKGGARAPEFLKLNPGGKVPVLVDDSLALSESAAICERLGRHSAAKLVPEYGSAEYSAFLQWSCFAIAELEQPLWNAAKHTFALPPERRVPAVLEVAPYEFKRAVRVLSQGLGERSFILGENFTTADILLAHTLLWAQQAKYEIESDNVKRYIERTTTRDAYRRARSREQAAKQS